ARLERLAGRRDLAASDVELGDVTPRRGRAPSAGARAQRLAEVVQRLAVAPEALTALGEMVVQRRGVERARATRTGEQALEGGARLFPSAAGLLGRAERSQHLRVLAAELEGRAQVGRRFARPPGPGQGLSARAQRADRALGITRRPARGGE